MQLGKKRAATAESATFESIPAALTNDAASSRERSVSRRFLTLSRTSAVRIEAIEGFDTVSDTLLIQLRTGSKLSIRLANNASFSTTLQGLVGGFISLSGAVESSLPIAVDVEAVDHDQTARPRFATFKRNPLTTDAQTVCLDLIDAYELMGPDLVLHVRSGCNIRLPITLLQNFKAVLALAAGEEIPLQRVVDENRVPPNLGNEVDLFDPYCYQPEWAPLHRG